MTAPTISIRDSAWMRLGSCNGVETDLFFTELDEVPSSSAVALCAFCPVKPECLQHALDNDEDGYWGGTTKAQRLAITSGRHRVKCPGCSSRDVIDLGNSTVCIGCGLSW